MKPPRSAWLEENLIEDRRLGYFLVFGGAIGFALLPIFGRAAYAFGASPVDVVTLRLVLGAPVMWLIVAIAYRGIIRFDRAQFARLLAMALVGSIGSEIGIFTAIQYIDVSLALTIAFTSPMLVSLLAVPLYREHFSVNKALSLTFTMAGVALTSQVYRPEALRLNGVGLVIAAAVALAFTFYTLLAKKVAEEANPITVTVLLLTIAAIALVLGRAGAVLSGLAEPPGFITDESGRWGVIAVCGAMAVTSTGIPTIAFIAGLKRIGASRASIASMVELPMTVLLATVFLSERLSPLQILGICAVLAGVVVLQRHQEASDIVHAQQFPKKA